MRATTKPMEANAFTKFKLLMWKNFLQQWRHRIQTLFELLLPVITMCLVLLLRWQIEPYSQATLTYPSIPAHSLDYSSLVIYSMVNTTNLNETEFSIAYSPASPELDDVVRSAFANLLIRNIIGNKDIADLIAGILDIPEIELPPDLDLTPIHAILKRLVRVHEFNTSYDMRGLYADEQNTRKVVAALEFDDLLHGTSQLPNNITYSIRFPERPRLNAFYGRGGSSWRTELVFPAFEVGGGRHKFSWEGGDDPGYVNEMFIALQNAVSTEIISRITGEDLTQFDINIQRYPHPSYLQDSAVEVLQFLLSMFIQFALSYTAVNIVRAVTVEKELQLKETMKIMGLPTWLHWTAWFCKQFIFLFISSVLIVIILKANWFKNEEGSSDYAVLTNTPWTVLLFFINIYMICLICFCFMISGCFSRASTAALFTGVVWFLTGVPATLLMMENEVSVALQAFTCLSINSAMIYGFQLLLAQESTGGLQWGDFFSSPSTETSRFMFGHVVLMMILDSIIYMLIALYLEQVLPGPFGTPKRWNFLFTKDFWFTSKDKYRDFCQTGIDPDDVLKESDPVGHTVGVNINNLTKAYGSNIVVDHLCMNIYNDQITVLLGHNGAGKSTTISMLTGNLKATYGSVSVAGYDVLRQSRAARSHLGLCPQHNVLFNELTVREHLEFFARLKGFKGQELEDDIDSLIEKLELQEKRDCPSKDLSGGQKRRLCVGIALSGAADVVLLDEPTSGMDPASRRGLWALLQKEKKGRSMILTTHFMDEADFLGDRIAIMAHGRLQCVGSPQFLKRHHGLGYQLVVVKDHGFDYDKCLKLMNKHMPDITCKDDRGTEVTFSLLNDHSHLFEAMLEDLENNVVTVKFKNYGLVATTLEDVFMSMGADLELVNSASEDDITTVPSDAGSLDQLHSSDVKMDVTGFPLIMQHFLAMWFKLWHYWTRSWGMVLLQLTVPIILINLTLLVARMIRSFTENVVPRNLTLTEGFARTETLLSFNGSSLDSVGALAAQAYESMFASAGIDTMQLNFVGNQNLRDYYLDRSQESPNAMGALRHTVLTGASFNENSATAWFSNFGYHDVAVSLAAVHSALLKAVDSTAHLHVYNFPLLANYERQDHMQAMMQIMALQLSNGIGSSVGIVSAVFVMFYIKERASGAKLLQRAAGLQPVVMWLSAAIFDWLWFIILCLTILASCAIFKVAGLSTPAELGRLYVCILIYGASMLPMNYLFTHLFKGPAVGFVVVFFVNVLFGMMGAQVVTALDNPILTTEEAARILDYILQFFPMYGFVTSVRKLNELELTVQSCMQLCDYLVDIAPNTTECTMQTACDFVPACCVRDYAHFEWEDPGILRYLLVMCFSGVILWAALMVVEYRLLQRLFTRKRVPPPRTTPLDPDVADEEHHVSRIDPTSLNQHGLVARGLSKYYGKHNAVNQIGFSVNDSECFGLLGVNGAGKTTTFKMLMGDETISSGEAFVNGYSVEKQLNSVYANIGYCPQFDALFNELTGRETLHLFSLLRGMRSDAIDLHATTLATSLGFLVHLDKKVGEYSGGTKRKLNTAVAFLGKTRLVFVDEPTTGVDPAAKRHVWRAVQSVQKSGRGVVLTSHSMEECEALCSRLTIMVNGRFQCLGTPQHLKNKFSQGYTLTIKLRLEQARIPSNCPTTNAVKDFVNSNFMDAKIMEEYQGVLTYYLPDLNMPWSKMFGAMERAKRDVAIEYYNISQTTLEQIFLQFTKYQIIGKIH